LDNLHDQESSPFSHDEDEIDINTDYRDFGFNTNDHGRINGKFLGLKPVQLFIILVMLLSVVFLLGMMLLLVTGKLVPSFL